ncbi:MAG: hypothetical protein QOE45_2117 [Frankiaceae bacterium]|nr:hypothetical protein [Frankiaceae bacterium]
MKKPEDVRYGATNIEKFADENPLTAGLLGRFMGRCADHVEALTSPGESILDCGVAEGTMTRFLTDRLPDRRVVAMEYEDEACAIFHRQFGDIPLLRGSIYDLPFPDGSVDVVTAFEVLEHLADPGKALEEMRRVARRRVVVTVPYEPFFRMGNIARGKYLKRLGNTPGHINHWTRSGLRRLVSSRIPSARVDRAFPWLMATGSVDH